MNGVSFLSMPVKSISDAKSRMTLQQKAVRIYRIAVSLGMYI